MNVRGPRVGDIVDVACMPDDLAVETFAKTNVRGYVTESFRIVVGVMPGYGQSGYRQNYPATAQAISLLWRDVSSVPALFSEAIVAYPAREDHEAGTEKVIVIEGTLVERDMCGIGSDGWRADVIKAATALKKKLGQDVIRVDFHDAVITVPLRG